MNEMSEQSRQDMWNYIHKQREEFIKEEVERDKRAKEREAQVDLRAERHRLAMENIVKISKGATYPSSLYCLS